MAKKQPQITPSYSDSFLALYVTMELPFTNWSAHQVDIWGQHFATVEHAYQYKKFEITDPAWARKIKHAKSPYEAKVLAHQKDIDEEAWAITRESVMQELLQAKVDQHEDVRAALLNTGKDLIAKVGRHNDDYWGMGADGLGQNVLGRLWMHLRNELMRQSGQ